jgi:competence protein ComEC
MTSFRTVLWWWATVVIVLGFFSLDLLGQLPDGRLHILTLDVGQGDAIFLRTPHGKTVMIDAGKGHSVMNQLPQVLNFFDRKIDIAIVTHFDSDHAEGFLDVLRSYQVGQIFLSGALKGSPLENKFFQAANQGRSDGHAGGDDAGGVPIAFVRSDRDIELEPGIFLDFLYPFLPLTSQHFDALNDTSVTLRLVVDVSTGENTSVGQRVTRKSLLFSGGDMGFDLEDLLMKSGQDLRAEILKVSHHGSKYSSGAEFLRAVAAKMALISVGAKNRYGHPTAEALGRLQDAGITNVRRTDREGRIDVGF